MKSTLSFYTPLQSRLKIWYREDGLVLQGIGKSAAFFSKYSCCWDQWKGSVCTMLDSIYRANDYRVGLFTSPHIIELGERIRVNGKPFFY